MGQFNFRYIQRIWVVSMFSLVSQLLSSSATAGEKVYPHEITLSGNVFRFSMPEDFSKDMPAQEVVTALDISDLQRFDNGEYGNLARRWWDIKTPGWFGKKLGTVMMDISVQRVVSNKQQLLHKHPYDIKERMDFILMLDDAFHQRYDTFNAEIKSDPEYYRKSYHSVFATVSGRELFSLYHDYPVNLQKWIKYSIAAPRSELIINFSLPVDNDVYIEVSFTYSHNNNVLPREFREAAYAKMAAIEQSLQMSYAPGNPFAKIVSEDWMEYTNTEVLEQHREDILKLFYGSDPEAAIQKMEQESLDSYERDQQMLREALSTDSQ